MNTKDDKFKKTLAKCMAKALYLSAKKRDKNLVADEERLKKVAERLEGDGD